ncbi:MAG: N-6 DNA methylase [Leptospiraceae bacterium]|nr:N-6 DNA methylase [Leptospiraceae bacterium]
MYTKEEALVKITELVRRFDEQIDSYKKSDYNETLTRRDFIDPFFKALGWDMDNEQGAAESYREVIHEDKIKVGGATKAPDYSFRLAGGKRLFFVEAKKPSIVVKDDILPAYQVRRYGWSAKLAISIITDFEEFAVYDCTKKPNSTDKASVARIKYITFKEYISEFDFLWNTFSKEKVIQGSFDTFIKSDTNKKGTTTVDKEFLNSLDTWRTSLAANISKTNLELDEDEINFAVQQFIDRIIFLRIAEDRAVEEYGTLLSAVGSGLQPASSSKRTPTDNEYYTNLVKLYMKADDKYNSGIFDFKKDRISTKLKVDNKVVKAILTELYYPECPYEFSVLSVEILGSAYEQFLGKQIKINPPLSPFSKGGKRGIWIEEKPEVRKAGGVYYTPEYIVEYIVKQTVGKLIEGKTPKEIEKIKVVDPACGSGSFLIGAFQYLLDWHKNYYAKNKKSWTLKNSPLTPQGDLTTGEKRRILLNNIHGVDIDVNAVEVTKLSLLLKCMEGETEASINNQLRLFNERVLPSLDDNIKSGNSLIDTDFYDNELDFGGDKKIKPFHWQSAFPQVFNPSTGSVTGGFDAVIGNPPYGASFASIETNYFLQKYKLQDYQLDSYFIFIEKSFEVLRDNGLLGFIIPNTWLLNLNTSKIRSHLFSKTEITNIVHFKNPVFSQAVVDTEIMIFRNTKPRKTHNIKIEIYNKQNEKVESKIKQQNWIDANGSPVNIFDNPKNHSIKIKLSSLPILDTICKITQGTKPFQVGKGNPPQTRAVVNEKLFVAEKKVTKLFKPLLRGSLMNRYQINWDNNYFIKFGDWLAEPRYSAEYDAKEKIIIRQTSDHLSATLDTRQFIVRDNLYTIVHKLPSINLRFILGLINSKFMNWYYQNIINPEKGEALAQVKRGHIAVLPIKTIDPKNKTDLQIHDEIVKNVDLLLKLNEELQTIKLHTKIEEIKGRIERAEDNINQAVYKLYDLTKEEILVVEGVK